jgi:hypothetical protein
MWQMLMRPVGSFLLYVLKDINPSKATGLDQIPNIVLKTCAKTLAPGMTKIFQKSIDYGELTDDWLKCSTVFKKGDVPVCLFWSYDCSRSFKVTIICVSHEYPDLNPWFKDVRKLYFFQVCKDMFAYCGIRSSTWNCPWTFIISMPDQWPTRVCEVSSSPLCRWLPALSPNKK